ncbi:cyclin-dependent kinase inhibitor 3-like [Benincasa hispida]|uniref:cyclin-dependent kinase inhibitor 3-like n=1 Tax=Benincasa hispida TaxID=102211 RepID=UPI001901E821|nr:cyclin-dependent kinase inhibitor 3-like [Benincasa hispida]
MGKYMNKSKVTGDVALMEVFSHPTTTVRTRAASKSLALQNLQKSSLPDATPDLSFSYLQLRTRRLDKTERSIGASTKHASKPKKSARNSSSATKATSNLDAESQSFAFEAQTEDLEFELSRRHTNESTAGSRNPCSPTQYSSDTATNGIIQNNLQRTIPTAHEMEEFFASAEHQQQISFMNKYNYDIVNDKPLNGQYEWVELVL